MTTSLLSTNCSRPQGGNNLVQSNLREIHKGVAVQDPQVKSNACLDILYSRVAGFRGKWLESMNNKTAAARNAQARDLRLPLTAPRTAVAEELQPYVSATRWPTPDYSTISAHLQQLLRPTGAPYLLIVDSSVYRSLRYPGYMFLLVTYVAFGVFFIVYWLVVWIEAPLQVITVFGTVYMLLGVLWGIGGLIVLYFHCCMSCRQQVDVFAPAPHEFRIHILALHMLYAADRLAGSRGGAGEAEEVPEGQLPTSVAEMDIPVRLRNNGGYVLHKHTVYSDGSVMYENEIVQENHWDVR